jgi:hypothetical protein
VRYFDHVPLYCSLITIDDSCFVNQYLFSASSDNSPFYCVRGIHAAWPKLYAHEFDTIWNLAIDPFAASGPSESRLEANAAGAHNTAAQADADGAA